METDLLIVDDDDEFRRATVQYFQKHGYHAEEAADGEQALRLAKERVFHVAVLDLRMPGMSGIDVLDQLRASNIETEVIVLTGEGTIETAVQAMKLGAHDFLTKPVRYKQLAAVIEKALEAGQLRKENRQLRAMIERTRGPASMVGESAAMREVYRLIERTGKSDKPILIQGESGTGKELVAKALHQASSLADKPLVLVNCAALPETLLESELFGHEKGAFTGAATAKPGLFEIADGGTLFIDEIGELSGALQPKLLRVLEDGWMRRIGSVKDRRVSVRILAATNRDLAQEVEASRFREDLFYRINVMTIPLPPLRARGDDVLLLADHFTGPGWEWEPRAREALKNYHWPGNVRQLANAIERAKILGDDELIRFENLPPEVTKCQKPDATTVPLEPEIDLATLNRAHVLQVMKREQGNKMRAAKALGVSRRSLYRLLEKYHIKTDEYAAKTDRS
jgi:DNA-binding NtrC family response regulator